ncbi:basic helix-loop-helix domain-containing protein USF3 [Hyla sarda]|uniref:basic helix-loop-helix domain-containing protein USF3 n=1 Tax=Hyla sarda TaxID=327740 RepID=UPI0024C3476A|nr:basic helix-loop-helix domain-containing protein USF3 [Hyla sarda]XP_056415925.1 basic helix-loop-helix domain-containing protein USF3 [Hyla sarda]
MPEMTQNASPTKSKHRKKNRESHNEVERHRKKKINSGINRIGDLIPCSPALKQSKNMILEQAFKYITELKRQNDELLLNGGNKEQATEIKKLRRELAEIQKENARYIELLKSNDICLYDDPTLNWKGNAKNSKASLIAPADQAPKLPLCLNSNQLGSSNQGTTMHGITFNIGHNLQKQTANVVPVQRACNLVTPITIAGVYPLDKTLQQNSAMSTTAGHVESSLPVTTTQSTVNLILSKGTEAVHTPSSSASSLPLMTSTVGTMTYSSQEGNGAKCSIGQIVDTVPKTVVSISSSLPSQVSQANVPGINVQASSDAHENTSGAQQCVEFGKVVERESLPIVDIGSSLGIAMNLREINSSVDVQAGSSVSVLPASSLENSWSLSSALPDLKSVGSLSRIPSDGNTQTTWTTLQLAGNTVQPLSQSSVITTALSEQPTASKDTLNTRPVTTCINLSNVASSEVKPVEQVMVKMPSCQPVQVQSLISQPQPQSTNILPLHPPVQVIQVAQPFGSAINPSPANQNIILLQPPAPAPRPPVPKAPVGQQIVIIQATPNQNTLPIMTAQPTPSVVMPINATNPVICPSNPVQGTVIPQTFGGKHLVHILPRPTPVQPSSTTQQVPVSTAAPNQQPPTISLNGQLFALQPMNPSAGSSNQSPMQIIQPTTNEDPNTNVALNTFGALANLSQNISQMAGQNCLQLTLNPPAPATVSSSTIPGNCVSMSGSNMTPTVADTSSASSVTTKPLLVKSVSATPANAKPKKTIKKPTAKKGAKKDSTATSKPDSSCPEALKTQTNKDPQNEKEKVTVLAPHSTTEEKADVAVAQSIENVINSKTGEVLNCETSEGEAATSEQRRDERLPRQDSSVTQNEPRQTTEPECFKGLVETSSHPVNRETLQEALVTEVSQESNELTTGKNSDPAAASRPCQVEDSSTLTAADLLEAQILTDDPSEKSFPLKGDSKDLDSHRTLFRKVQAKEPTSVSETSPEPIITNPTVHIAPNQTNISEQDSGSNSSAISRQTDSPLSSSSASSRNFSVASMLPDTNRDDVVSGGASLGPPFNGCGFSEHNDIVAVAARVIFDQETLSKGRSRVQAEVIDSVPRNSEAEMLPPDCRLPFKPHMAKENISRLPPSSNSFSALDSSAHPCVDHLVTEKSNCSVVNSTSLSLHISTSQSQSVTSLSINNLIRSGGVNHSGNCAGALPTSEHMSMPPSTNPSVSSSTYDSQTEVTTVLSDYAHEQLHSMSSAVMQVSQTTVPQLKQTLDGRKESNKRSAHEDGLLSAAKRQKQCQTPIRLERLQPSDSVGETNEVLVSHVSSNSSSSSISVSSSVQSHSEGLSNLFTPNNNFVNSTLRQTDLRCSSQPSISEQSHMGNQHLQPLQSNQHQIPLHSNNPYLKQQQQQAGHLRDHHHLYQQQQQQVPHVERSIRSQSHNIQQQRMIQQDVQMQKKQNAVQGAQAARLSLHQKHLTEQNRHKSGQPNHQQLQQQQISSHFGSAQAEKTCENNAPSRGLHVTHPQGHVSQDILHQHQQDISRSQGSIVSSDHLSGHSQVQRLMTSRSLEQQMASQASVVPRPSNMTCAPHRQERNRVSSYSAEALIGKSTSNSEQRIGVSVPASRLSEHIEMRKYLDVSRNKVIPPHNLQGHMSIEHAINSESQRLPDCQTFKSGSLNQQQPASFEIQTSRNNEGGTNANIRGLQSQGYRSSQNPNSAMDRQKHLPYQTAQEVSIANTLSIRENENSCHQSFMQSLLAPHIGDQVVASQRSISSHQRTQYNSSSIEFTCPPTRESLHLRSEGQNRESCDLVMGQVNSRNNSLNIPFSSSSSSGDIQGRNTSPHISMQKSNSVQPSDGQAKNQLNIQVSINMHGVVHPPIPHQSISHGNGDQRQTVRQANPPIAQRSRHPLQEEPDSKTRQPERNRSGNQRHSNMFDSTLPHLPLAGPGSMILGRQQPVTEKRAGIVRFMPDGPQVSTDNPTPDQHTLTQNFGFPFIPEGTMNPPINPNASFIPPVTQTAATRTPALIPVDPQNTLPSFYPPYSPAHPSLSNDLTLPYFSNQMFPNPSTEKPNSNRFGSILSPPRPVGFSQATFPLLPEMPPMHMANPSHLSNFNLTSLFPEIATALPADGSAVSPLLSISHPSASDSSKQSSNRPAHNISHILGHDSSSAV